MKQSDSNKELTMQAFELAATGTKQKYLLRLYIAGSTPQSNRAVANIKVICEEHLKGQYELEVIDLYEKPYLAAGEQILAAPTLIKQLPLPLRRIIGDMSDTNRVLVGLDLRRANQK
jgi:circadian clock protein KaiB